MKNERSVFCVPVRQIDLSEKASKDAMRGKTEVEMKVKVFSRGSVPNSRLNGVTFYTGDHRYL